MPYHLNLNTVLKAYHSILGVPDRARRKLFSTKVLRPNCREYRTISQKILSASAARFLILWLKNYVTALLETQPESEFLQCLGLQWV